MASEGKNVFYGGKDAKSVLNSNIYAISWALFLILVGVLWLLPEKYAPTGLFLFSTGIILLGMCIYRYIKGLEVSKFVLFVGILAVILGIRDLMGLRLPAIPIALIILGIMIIAGLLYSNRRR